MYLAKIPNRKSKPTYLLRESYRENGKVKTRTRGNVTGLPDDMLDAIRDILTGKKMVPVDSAIETVSTLPAGHVRAVLGTMKKLGIKKLLSSRPSRERDLVMGMMAQRILHPGSKLSAVNTWDASTLAGELGIEDATVEELYRALDWLFERQERIEKALARRHLKDGGFALYDMSNSLHAGNACPLARIGKDKEGRHGVRLVSYGLLTDIKGRPISINVYRGDTADPSTVIEQAEKLRDRFGLDKVVLVGDRGMLTNTKIEVLKKYPGIGWISALKSVQIRKLVSVEALQLSLFDQQNLAEIESADYPGEKLVACYNPLLAEDRSRTREEMLKVCQDGLKRIVREIGRRTKTPLKASEIGRKVSRVIDRYRMAKHFHIKIEDNLLQWSLNKESIEKEAALDGIYIIRTSETGMSSPDIVRSYKKLSRVEQAFRSIKGVNDKVRPIFHRAENRVRAHFFLCMLAYYVQWHMKQALSPMLFSDDEIAEAKDTADPVAKAQPSESAKNKKARKRTEDDVPICSFDTLMTILASMAQVKQRIPKTEIVFEQYPIPTPIQKKAFKLLGV
jgi:hypothetical protein